MSNVISVSTKLLASLFCEKNISRDLFGFECFEINKIFILNFQMHFLGTLLGEFLL